MLGNSTGSKVEETIINLGGIISIDDLGTMLKVKFSFPDFETTKKVWYNYYYRGGKITEHEAKENLFKIFCMDTNRVSLLAKDRYGQLSLD